MTINVNGKYYEVSLKVWDGNQYSPDFIRDMEIDLGDWKYDEDGVRACTPDEYRSVVEYWQSEVDAANSGAWSEQFGDWREFHAEPQELVLFADELEEA